MTEERKGFRLWLWYQGHKIRSWWKSGKCTGCERTLIIDYDKRGEAHYCIYCGTQNVVRKYFKGLRKPTRREIDRYCDHNDEWGEKGFLPTMYKQDVRFDVGLTHDGYWNCSLDKYAYLYPTGFFGEEYDLKDLWVSFNEVEDLLKIQYHQRGIMPSVGDILEGEIRNRKDYKIEVPRHYGCKFVVICRECFVDDWDTYHLEVIPYEVWHRLKRY
jgi:hypothetical protein